MLAGALQAVAKRLFEAGDVGAVATLVQVAPHPVGIVQGQVAPDEGVQLLSGLDAIQAVFGRIHLLSGVAARITPDSMA